MLGLALQALQRLHRSRKHRAKLGEGCRTCLETFQVWLSLLIHGMCMNFFFECRLWWRHRPSQTLDVSMKLCKTAAILWELFKGDKRQQSWWPCAWSFSLSGRLWWRHRPSQTLDVSMKLCKTAAILWELFKGDKRQQSWWPFWHGNLEKICRPQWTRFMFRRSCERTHQKSLDNCCPAKFTLWAPRNPKHSTLDCHNPSLKHQTPNRKSWKSMRPSTCRSEMTPRTEPSSRCGGRVPSRGNIGNAHCRVRHGNSVKPWCDVISHDSEPASQSVSEPVRSSVSWSSAWRNVLIVSVPCNVLASPDS